MLRQPELLRTSPGNVSIPANSKTGIDSPRAWLIVLAAFFVSFVGFGITYSFGVFLKPLGSAFGVNHAAMSTIFSTLTVLSFFLAPLTRSSFSFEARTCVLFES